MTARRPLKLILNKFYHRILPCNNLIRGQQTGDSSSENNSSPFPFNKTAANHQSSKAIY